MSVSDRLDFVPLTSEKIVRRLHHFRRQANRDGYFCTAPVYAQSVRDLLASLRCQIPGLYLPGPVSQARAERLVDRGNRQMDRGLETHALVSAFKALTSAPHYPPALVLAGRASLTLGNVEAAQRFLLQARWVNRTYREAEIELSYIGDIPDDLAAEFFVSRTTPPAW